ncbi:sigma-70 family RNA polymerase sigma factor [candidate division KSB3 bacterium]|uniref:Sigma-70 family RNA polymerase sigma factor n=1 Tax=candidate division KSB3 bacterium TaxID=2044937 RepID=A0A9D5Q7Q0_9BACT|nr:sigma-70 family RNA polymerase sigma factor [candidate division KSB3 bacterium]MBD3326146.1 sigma-70 family RNA polymerase sigma factor [candidate division KSB3 bacterium]
MTTQTSTATAKRPTAQIYFPASVKNAGGNARPQSTSQTGSKALEPFEATILEHQALKERDDFELIDLTLAGEKAAFEILVKRYSGSMYALAYRMLHDPDDAADICQDVFLKAYEALESFRKKSSFYTWLYRIGTNSCINHIRKNQAQHHIEFASYHAFKEADTLETLYKTELQEVVNDAIERLPEKQKATVMLRVCEGMSHREVSHILKCSVGTAKANYFHAIRNLRRFMKNYIAANEDDADVIPSSLLRIGNVAPPSMSLGMF